ncbi:gamma carbonic anhydrase family protein [Saccharomonospora sp. NB11]|jgi:carbonic anhydrase/acetyltransferase-like protein (isoleucine patch superfamily)|uniref:gamma carbonic anhydrase family protein n=1 Tax=Saccharomonospora sp. NB11 TaxID=1642298 RepID=UPI0018D08327|nr:gamma carbonic anhydrase family protein [Saccharomonospora sp. NB11]
MQDGPTTLVVAGASPTVDPAAWIAPTAVLAGAVTVAEAASVWYTAVLRGDMDSITIGRGSNLQDGTVVHADPGYPVTVGSGVSVGHRAVLHGCEIGDDCLIGMSATILNGATIGEGTLVAAGAVVLEGTEIPPGSLVAGVPAKVRRSTTEEERAAIRANAESYRALAATHAEARPS